MKSCSISPWGAWKVPAAVRSSGNISCQEALKYTVLIRVSSVSGGISRLFALSSSRFRVFSLVQSWRSLLYPSVPGWPRKLSAKWSPARMSRVSCL